MITTSVCRLNVRPNVGFSPTRRITQLSNTLAAPTVLATPETVPSVEESKGLCCLLQAAKQMHGTQVSPDLDCGVLTCPTLD